MRPETSSRGGMYSLSEDMEMKENLSTLARRLEEQEMRNQHEVRAIAETPLPNQYCFICQSTKHQGEHCPTTPAMQDMIAKQANVLGNTSHRPMPHIVTHIIIIGGTILTSPGNQRLHHMYPLLHNTSMVPHPRHSHNHHHL